LIHFDDLRSAHAADSPRRIADTADLVTLSQIPTIQKPDVIHVIHMNTRYLLHAPSVGQSPGPERVHLEQRRTVLVLGLHLRLRGHTRAEGKHQDTANDGS
jgi:hypothetical protein